MSDLPAETKNISATNLIMQGDSFDRVMRMAEIMASGVATIPKHLQKNQADCTAIVMQSMQWGMNPFAVAQKTHITQGGTLGYEAQLVNAVIMANGPLAEHPSYEFIGDWDRILGRVKEMQSEGKGKYYVKDWQPADESGLGVICHYTIIGLEPRSLKLMLKQCWPRFSTQWATDPQQQICYAVIKKIARREFPGVILGVYTLDELEDYEEKVINPIPKDDDQPPPPEPVKYYPDEAFEKNFPKWREAVEKGSKTHGEWINTLSAKFPLTEEQKQKILEVKAPIPGEAVEVQNDNANS